MSYILVNHSDCLGVIMADADGQHCSSIAWSLRQRALAGLSSF
jgi:hypothetical protein